MELAPTPLLVEVAPWVAHWKEWFGFAGQTRLGWNLWLLGLGVVSGMCGEYCPGEEGC